MARPKEARLRLSCRVTDGAVAPDALPWSGAAAVTWGECRPAGSGIGNTRAARAGARPRRRGMSVPVGAQRAEPGGKGASGRGEAPHAVRSRKACGVSTSSVGYRGSVKSRGLRDAVSGLGVSYGPNLNTAEIAQWSGWRPRRGASRTEPSTSMRSAPPPVTRWSIREVYRGSHCVRIAAVAR